MNRRGFLGSILALSAAPAIVRAESLMRIRPIVYPADFALRGSASWVSSPFASKLWGEALFREVSKPTYFGRLVESGLLVPRETCLN